MILHTTPALFRTTHVVYHVTYRDQAFYVGSCPLADLSRLKDAQRNSEWQRLRIGADEPIVVTIHALFSSASDATAAAEALITTLRPHCNVHGAAHTPTPRKRGGPVRCVATGQTWPNVEALAEALCVTTQAVHAHLRGDILTLKGARYERVDS